MLPKFLKQFEAELQPHKMDCVVIKAIPLKPDESIDIKQSKFGGRPYMPLGTEYPLDGDHLPQFLLAQINFEEVPRLKGFPAKGILQFFVDGNWIDMTGSIPVFDEEDDDDDEFLDRNCIVLFHKDTGLEYLTDFSFMTNEWNKSPITCEHKLEFKRRPDYGSRTDSRIEAKYNELTESEKYRNFNADTKEEFSQFIYDNIIGHKLGGYAYFHQSDPHRENPADEYVQLLQIDTDGCTIGFGDVGTAHFFLNKKDFKKRNFIRSYFYYDCC